MCLALDENLGDIDVSIPAEANGLCAFRLFEAAKVKVKIFIVKVNGRDGCVFGLKFLVRVEYCKIKGSDRTGPEREGETANQGQVGVA